MTQQFDCSDAQLIDEVRRRGFIIRDAQIYTEKQKRFAQKKEWVGLTDEEVITMSRYDLQYAALIGEVQRKLKEKNT